MNGTAPLFECPDPRPPWERDRIRPPRYVVVRAEDVEQLDEDEQPDGADEEYGYFSRYEDSQDGAFDDEAVWDNWYGGWLTAPAWTDNLDMVAEGYARYDLRGWSA